jgi:predicted nuclease of predicted toxin-antitoxin system
VKLLLDECIDRRLSKEIEGHQVVTVPQAGWAGIQNGELLRLAQAQFDVFVTVDQNLSFQQHLQKFTIAVIVLQAQTNRLEDLLRLIPHLQRILASAPKGQVTLVGEKS